MSACSALGRTRCSAVAHWKLRRCEPICRSGWERLFLNLSADPGRGGEGRGRIPDGCLLRLAQTALRVRVESVMAV